MAGNAALLKLNQQNIKFIHDACNDKIETQMLVTSEQSMARPGCCDGCALDRRVWECGPGERGGHSGCPSAIELRAGWADVPCECNATRFALNCQV